MNRIFFLFGGIICGIGLIVSVFVLCFPEVILKLFKKEVVELERGNVLNQIRLKALTALFFFAILSGFFAIK